MAVASKKELKVFERLETMTEHESFNSATSFVRKFVDGNLDMNSTYQSIPEGDEGEEETGDVDQEGEDCNEPSYYSEGGEEEKDVECVGKGGKIPDDDDDDDDDDDYVEEYSSEEEDQEGDESSDESESSNNTGNTRNIGKSTLGQYNTSYLLLSEIKRSLELQETQLSRERKDFTEQRSTEQKKLESDKKQVEIQRQNLQRLITDYHKMKSSKTEHEKKVKELTEKLLGTKLEMNKRISRWGDQQRRLEERVKALENENADLKKQKSMSYRPALLKRPPLNVTQPQSQKTKQARRIHFADNPVGSSHSKPADKPTKLSSVKSKILKSPSSPPSVTEDKKGHEDDKENSQDGTNQSTSTVEEQPAYPREVCLSDDDADKTMPTNYVEVKHHCGTITRIAKDNKLIRHVMVNNDVMDEFEDCSVRYHYSELGFSQITYPSGDEIIEYDGGILETHRADGTKIYTYADGLVKLVDPLSSEEIYFPDGSTMRKDSNGTSTITWPSGQKEERTSTYTKRIYTNGTVKIKYTDGSEETRYWNGRVRRKDKDGRLVDDTKKRKTQKLDKVNKTA